MSHGLGELPNGLRKGDILAGKYRIGATIGAGAMGTVVAAHHLMLDEKVAIKFLRGDPSERADAVARFVREARAVVRIRNEHVVRVLDIAELEDGPPYIVMEYLDGCDLAEKLRAAGPLRVVDAVGHILEACEAMAEAHRMGIVHRDLKPANLFLSERVAAPSSIKVLDFGIAKTLRLVPTTLSLDETALSAGITHSKAILGSPYYMSPEQMESSGDVDARTDIWALGVTFFELVTGRHPYTGSSLIQVYSSMISQDAASWRAALSDHPEGLQTILARCLAHDREERYANVGDFASALAPFGSARAAASLQRIGRTLAEAASEDGHTTVPVALRSSDSAPRGIEEPMPPSDAGSKGRLRRMLGSVFIGGVFASAVLALVGLARNPGTEPRKTGAPEAVAATAEPAFALSAVSTASAEPERGTAAPSPVAPTMTSASVTHATRTGPWPRQDAPTGATTLPHAPPPKGAMAPPVSSTRTESPAAAGESSAMSGASSFGAKKIKEMLGARE